MMGDYYGSDYHSTISFTEVHRRFVGISGNKFTTVKSDLIQVKPKMTRNHDTVNSMQRAMTSILLVAQCFALCPVQGITSHNADDLRFSWWSLRIAYLFIVMVTTFISMGFAVVWFFKKGLSFDTSGNFVFHIIAIMCCIVFLKIARGWPKLARLWQRTEINQIVYGYPKNLRFKLRAITIIILTLALVEHLLAQYNTFSTASICSTSFTTLILRYIVLSRRQVFELTAFSVPMAVFTSFTNFFTSFYWTFVDLFVIVISAALASRFRLLNDQLKSAKGKVMPDGFWRIIRENYNDLSLLTKALDSEISGLVFLSFSSNLYYICQQLYNSMTNTATVVEMVYFYVSFGYLLFRAISVNLYAASIYDESIIAKGVLYAVPTNSYHIEVHRLLIQITTDTVALTGLNFFPVTRTILLTLAGTIVTYEVVLVQFKNTSALMKTNQTELCLSVSDRLAY